MKRLVQILFVAIWIVGTVVGGLDVWSSGPALEEGSLHLLVDTDHARLGANRSHVVLTIKSPWRSWWRVTAPIPEILAPDRSEKPPPSHAEAAAPSSALPPVIRSLASLP